MKTLTLINDPSVTTRRTADEVNAILDAYGISTRAENMGDGCTFYLPTFNTVKLRKQLKRAGFELTLGRGYDKYIVFKCF